MSDGAREVDEVARGLALLPQALSAEVLDSAPVLESVDSLLIDELTDEEDDAFAAALSL